MHKSPAVQSLVSAAIAEQRGADLDPPSEPELDEARELDISEANEALERAQ